MFPRYFHAALVGAGLLIVPAVAGAQVAALTLQHVRDLYTQAAYEDALDALSRLPETEAPMDSARYRAACLLALGRVEEAQKAVAAVVESHPEYRPDAADTSPRVMDLFKTTRRQMMPQIARRLYSEAKEAMDRSETAAAVEGFERLLRVIDEPEWRGETTLAELKLLASGFLELNRARLPAAAPKVPELPAARPSTPPVLEAAVPIRQQLPPWNPPDTMSQRANYSGAVLVRIGADGKVTGASLTRPIHPAYDSVLLAAAREWQYQPAKQNGVAVPSERTVQVVLKPR